MTRRYIYDPSRGCVVDLGDVKLARGVTYAEVLEDHKSSRTEKTGAALRDAALRRAHAREQAHKHYGDERRWRD